TLPPTPTFAPTRTPVRTLTKTPTFAPTATPMPTLTNTPTFAPTDTPIPTPTDIALIMVAPLQTSLSSPTDTPTDLPSATPSLSATMVPSLTPAVTASLTYTALPIETLIPTSTATLVFTATATPTTTTSAALLVPPTGIVLVAVSVPPTGTVLVAVSVPPLLETNASEVPPRFPAEAVVGGLVLIGILSYAGVYWSGANAIERYANGFPTDDCPVCKRGSLTVETRVDRVIGVPRPRFVVTCDTCRSVLREVGGRRWRYAIDRSANPMLYTQYNGRVVAEDKLVNLSAWNQSLSEPPIFEEESS
ncbi:MAG: hypothetical protein SGJ24_14660, partial [Chloroflexota bacterium]|nr:hypothetical protein [Chloroflexota bacterium]